MGKRCGVRNKSEMCTKYKRVIHREENTHNPTADNSGVGVGGVAGECVCELDRLLWKNTRHTLLQLLVQIHSKKQTQIPLKICANVTLVLLLVCCRFFWSSCMNNASRSAIARVK